MVKAKLHLSGTKTHLETCILAASAKAIFSFADTVKTFKSEAALFTLLYPPCFLFCLLAIVSAIQLVGNCFRETPSQVLEISDIF